MPLFMESLTLAKCRNFKGKSLPSLLSNCPKLKTLTLEGTQIKDDFLKNADRENSWGQRTLYVRLPEIALTYK